MAFANDRQKATVTVEKLGESVTAWKMEETEFGNVYVPVYQETAHANAVYEIIAKDDIVAGCGTVITPKGTVVDTLTTGTDGKAQSIALDLGEYEVVEKQAPEGLTIDPLPKTVTLSYQGQTVDVFNEDVQYVNDRQKVDVDLIKQMEQDTAYDLPISGAYEQVLFGVYAQEDIVLNEEVAVPAGSLVGFIVTDSNGKGVLYSDLPVTADPAQYFIKEIATDSRYILDEQEYPFEAAYQGQDIETIVCTINNGEPIVNKLKKGTAEISKVDVSDGKLLPNTGMEILDENGNTIVQGWTDDSGMLTFEKLPAGKYFFREFDAPDGYILEDTAFPFEVKEDGEIIKCIMTNQKEAAPTENPKTGDPLIPLLGVAVLIGGGAITTLTLRKRKK